MNEDSILITRKFRGDDHTRASTKVSEHVKNTCVNETKAGRIREELSKKRGRCRVFFLHRHARDELCRIENGKLEKS